MSLRSPISLSASRRIGGSPRPALIQPHQLLISSILQQAQRLHGKVEIVSRQKDSYFRYNYAQMTSRATQLANALIHEFGIKMGEVVGTMAFNDHRHLESYFAIPSIGAIMLTANMRLFPEQLEYITNLSDLRVLLVDLQSLPVLKQLIQRGKILCRSFIIMCSKEEMPDDLGFPAECYEAVIHRHPNIIEWPVFPETSAAALAFTSGTTGNPKGVLYSHRGLVLHTYATLMGECAGVTRNDSVLLSVGLFHVLGWGLGFSAAVAGARVVLPGHQLDGKSLANIIANEKITLALGVPTVWLGLFQHLDSNPQLRLPSLNRVMIGGSAAPRSMIEKFLKLGVTPIHLWGTSECSPLGSLCHLLPQHANLSAREKVDILCKQGRPLYGIEMRIVNEAGEVLPNDGESSGELEIRGPWVTNGYFKVKRDGSPAHLWEESENNNIDENSWFRTGDAATIDSEGYLLLTDRLKDVIKSGGEWISSIDLENAMMGHPGVQEAAVIGIPHEKWAERPLLIIVRKPSHPQLSESECLSFLRPLVASWWLPDGVEFVKEIPRTATGKISKLLLRKSFHSYQFKNSSSSSSSMEKNKEKQGNNGEKKNPNGIGIQKKKSKL